LERIFKLNLSAHSYVTASLTMNQDFILIPINGTKFCRNILKIHQIL